MFPNWPKRSPNGSRMDAEWTSNGPRSFNGSRTDVNRTKSQNVCQCAIKSLLKGPCRAGREGRSPFNLKNLTAQPCFGPFLPVLGSRGPFAEPLQLTCLCNVIYPSCPWARPCPPRPRTNHHLFQFRASPSRRLPKPRVATPPRNMSRPTPLAGIMHVDPRLQASIRGSHSCLASGTLNPSDPILIWPALCSQDLSQHAVPC